MGMGASNQVFYDPQTQQYYTDPSYYSTNAQHPLLRGYSQRTYLTGINQQPQQKSPINNLLAQSLAAKPNAPTLAQLFPTMGGMYNNANGLLGGFTGAGQYGAGRFLGSNVMGNPSLTSTAMNVT